MKVRTTWVVVGVLLGFLVVAGRLFDVQVVGQSRYRKASLLEHQRFVLVRGERGGFLDRNGQILAANRTIPSLVADPQMFRSRVRSRRVISRLAAVLNISQATLMQRLRKGKHFVWVRHSLSPSQADYFRTRRLPGLFVVEEEKRFYPHGKAFHAVLGATGLDNIGVSGLEKTYDRYLAGHQGARILEVSARGRSYFSVDQHPSETLAGNTLYTTIDSRLQTYAQVALDEQVEAFSAEGGVVVVMDPWTGAVLALATNRTGKTLEMNPAVSMVYEPGSIFKLITASAALNEHKVTPDETFDGHDGAFRIPGGYLHDDEPETTLTLAQILAKSSNIGISQVGLKLGPDLFYRYIRAFGFGKKTGIDFPGESAGIVHPPDRWSRRSIYSMSMGQEVGVTPIQIAAAVSAIANGGQLMRPFLVQRVVDRSGHVIYRRNPKAVRTVVSKETCRILLGLMKNVVAPGGTGVHAVIQGYDVAGKTGTAQVYDPLKHAYTRRRTIDSFVGVFPVSHPSLVILAVVIKPRHLSWGGTVAAPLFRKVAEMALVHFRIPSDTVVSPSDPVLGGRVMAEALRPERLEKFK